MKTLHKSLALSLRGYISAIFSDVQWMYGRPSDWKRDHSRLLHELGIKGVRLLTIDFPAVAKHFDMCLDRGFYSPCALPLTGICSKRIQVPAFLRGLYLRIFDNDGKLRVVPCPDAILAIRTILAGAKKLRLRYKERNLHDELDEFIKCEQEVQRPSLNWCGDDLFDPRWVQIHGVPNRPVQECVGKHSPHLARRLHLADNLVKIDTEQLVLDLQDPDATTKKRAGIPEGLVETMQRVADIVSSSFGDFHIERPLELPKHGPGVVSDVKTGESKYEFPYWTPKTDAIFPYDLYGVPTLGTRIGGCGSSLEYTSHEVPSRIIAVPKSAKGPRLIASEPSAHQWLQQLVLSQLVGRLGETPIHAAVRFDDQSRNRELALRGSIHGSFATIDLSSASDRLSCWSVERFFRANPTLLERLHACRTRSAAWYGSSGYPSFRVVLNKFAPMGSACTFPVQSIIYCIVAVSVRLHLSNTPPTTHTVRDASARCSVFGDDIIVPKDDCPTVIKALEYLGLKVNTSKTFWTGKFRESCGIDAWGGHDVTPPYILTLLEGIRYADGTSSIEVSNNFYRKGFWKTARFIQDRLGKMKNLIPISARSDLGGALFSYSGTQLSHLKRRYNHVLQREEVRCLTTKSSKDRGPASPNSRLFQWFIEKPRPDTHWVSGVVSRKNSSTSSGWHPVDKFSGPSNGRGVD